MGQEPLSAERRNVAKEQSKNNQRVQRSGIMKQKTKDESLLKRPEQTI